MSFSIPEMWRKPIFWFFNALNVLAAFTSFMLSRDGLLQLNVSLTKAWLIAGVGALMIFGIAFFMYENYPLAYRKVKVRYWFIIGTSVPFILAFSTFFSLVDIGADEFRHVHQRNYVNQLKKTVSRIEEASIANNNIRTELGTFESLMNEVARQDSLGQFSGIKGTGPVVRSYKKAAAVFSSLVERANTKAREMDELDSLFNEQSNLALISTTEEEFLFHTGEINKLANKMVGLVSSQNVELYLQQMPQLAPVNNDSLKEAQRETIAMLQSSFISAKTIIEQVIDREKTVSQAKIEPYQVLSAAGLTLKYWWTQPHLVAYVITLDFIWLLWLMFQTVVITANLEKKIAWDAKDEINRVANEARDRTVREIREAADRAGADLEKTMLRLGEEADSKTFKLRELSNKIDTNGNGHAKPQPATATT
jgi:hypothetical protein